MKNITDKMIDFINKSTDTYVCTQNLRQDLIKNGYIELEESSKWDLKNNSKYFVVRGDSSLIAFQTNDNKSFGFNIISAHSDSPSFTIKTQPDIINNGYLKLNTSPYGGMINYTWFDRPLSISGRVILEKDNVYEKKIINIDKDILIIPSQAIHINRDVNEKATFNYQKDMLPVMYLGKEIKFNDYLAYEINEDKNIISYDLSLYNRDKGKYCGIASELILSPRLDDLACLYPAYEGFKKSFGNNNAINVFCSFNNEEIGSMTKQGADSSFLIDTLTRISNSLNKDIYTALSNSIVLSADNAHGVHPNATEKSDFNNKVELNKGIVIKHHINYTTDALSEALFTDMCKNAKVPYQHFTCRSDMKCGATLGGVSQRHVSIDSVDIGLAQLAMHSANETMGSLDPVHMNNMAKEFYNSGIKKENGKVRILRK